MVLKKIALTGASSMLGLHIIKKFTNKGYDVLALSRTKPKINSKNLQFKFFDFKKRITDFKLNSILDDYNIIIHAGCTSNYRIESNKKNTYLKNLEITKRIAKFAYLKKNF